MGQEVPCTAKWERKTSTGRAQLETDYLLFRGDFRVKLSFADITEVVARDGSLSLDSAQGKLVLDLGTRAGKWADKILHPPILLDKLGVKADQRVSIVGPADDGFVDLLESRSDLSVSRRPRKDSDQVFLFAEDEASASKISSLRNYIKPAGSVWIVYPKGRKGFTENDVLGVGRRTGMKDVKVARFSDSHTALKFVIPVDQR